MYIYFFCKLSRNLYRSLVRCFWIQKLAKTSYSLVLLVSLVLPSYLVHISSFCIYTFFTIRTLFVFLFPVLKKMLRKRREIRCCCKKFALKEGMDEWYLLVNRKNGRRRISFEIPSLPGCCIFLQFFHVCDSANSTLYRLEIGPSDSIRGNPLTMEISQFPHVTPF